MADGSVAGAVSLKGRVSEEEWQARVDLAALYRLAALYEWDDMIYTHISARIPGPEHHFLINPYGMWFEEITASSLVKVDQSANVIGHAEHPVNPAGFTVHAAIHDGIEGAHCVMHTHTTAGSAVACLREGLSQSNFYSAQLHAMVTYHAFEGITIHAEEAPRLLASIGTKPAVILRNHGLLAWGDTIARTFAERPAVPPRWRIGNRSVARVAATKSSTNLRCASAEP